MARWVESIASARDGTALISVIMVLTLLSTVMASMYMVHLAHRKLVREDGQEVKAYYLAEAALNRVIAMDEVPFDQLFKVGYGPDTVAVTTRPHGLMLRVETMVPLRRDSIRITNLVGRVPSEVFANAIVVESHMERLTLTGSVHIHGDILTGPGGIQTASLRGIPYSGRHDGHPETATGMLIPPFRFEHMQAWDEHVSELLHSSDADPIRLTEDMARGDRLWVTQGSVVIEPATSLPFGTILIAGGSVQMGQDVSGNGLMVHALGAIQIGPNARVSGQFIAADSIGIGPQAYLEYPSVVCLTGNQQAITDLGVIRMGEESVLDGTAMIPPKVTVRGEDHRRLIISESAILRGTVYNHARTELIGRVDGSILTRQFYFYQAPTHYVNWIRNGSVRASARPTPFVLPFAIGGPGRPSVIHREVVR